MLRVVVLGAAAGGGVPQWNCGCAVCRKARSGHPELQSTQASIAVSADGEHWFLINASPDLRQQLTATPQLHPRAGELRHSPISGVILTNGEIDAVAAGSWPVEESPLRGAPHTAASVAADSWDKPYGRELAAFPLASLRADKYWPPVRRIDGAYGDRHLVCSCPPIESYTEHAEGQA